jgi:hypothetical protein
MTGWKFFLPGVSLGQKDDDGTWPRRCGALNGEPASPFREVSSYVGPKKIYGIDFLTRKFAPDKSMGERF